MFRRSPNASMMDWRERIDAAQSTVSSQREIRIIFTLWLIAFFLKHAGSAWDVAWHFRYVFGALEPPHWLNVVGNGLAGALFAYQIATGKAIERVGFLVMQIAFVVFLIHMPLDVLNHWIFGLDVTVWSPTHMLGFGATTVMMIGLLYSWQRLAEPGRWRLVVGLICVAFLLDDVIFMIGQQEYGVVALEAYARGIVTASPELLAQAGRNPDQFVRGGIPDWVYPLWMVLTGSLVQIVGRRVIGWRWTAVAATLLYLAFRVVGRLLLGAFDFPVSFIPLPLLLGAFVVDVAGQRDWRPVVLALALTVAYYSSALLLTQIVLMPSFVPSTAPVAFVALWGGMVLADWWRSHREQVPLAA